MVDACAAAAADMPVAGSDPGTDTEHKTYPSTSARGARAAAAPSAAAGGDDQAAATSRTVAPDDPNPTEAELAEARQRRKLREEVLGHNYDDEPQPGSPGTAGGTTEVDADGYYEESRWYDFTVGDLEAGDGSELVLSDDGGDADEGGDAADAGHSGDRAESSSSGMYRWAESELSAAAEVKDGMGAVGLAQARAEEETALGVVGAAAAKVAPEVGAAAPATGAPTAAVASGDAAKPRPAPSSPFVVPKLAYGSQAERTAAVDAAAGVGVTATPNPTSTPGTAGPASPLPLPFGGRVGARLQQMGLRATGAGAAAQAAAGSMGTGPPAGASSPQATSAHRPKSTATAGGGGSGPGGPALYVRGAAPPAASGAPSGSRAQAPRISAAGILSSTAGAPGAEFHMPGAGGGAGAAQVAAPLSAGGRPEPRGEQGGATGELAVGEAAAGDGERARQLTTAELRDVAQRRGLSFDALVQGARKRGVEIQGD